MAVIVTLCEPPATDIEIVLAALMCFRRVLKARLGARMDDALRAHRRACGPCVHGLTQAEKSLAEDYQAAYEAARTAGFLLLGAPRGAYFHVMLT